MEVSVGTSSGMVRSRLEWRGSAWTEPKRGVSELWHLGSLDVGFLLLHLQQPILFGYTAGILWSMISKEGLNDLKPRARHCGAKILPLCFAHRFNAGLGEVQDPKYCPLYLCRCRSAGVRGEDGGIAAMS